MRRLKTIMLLALLGLMSACINELDERIDYVGENTPTSPQSPYHISLSQALDNLKATSSALGLETTRSLERGNWTVQRIPLSHFNSKTRTNETTEDSDAVYVVNFDNAEGYALLSADNRLPDDVIAVTNSGTYNFTPGPVTDFENPLDSISLEDLYVIEDDDYLLGSSEEGAIINDLLSSYVNHWIEVGEANTSGDNRTNTRLIEDPLFLTYEYESVERIGKLLSTTWHQRSPFNDQCPKRHFYRNFLGITMSQIKDYDFDAVSYWGNNYIRTETIASGCVAIAVAQILAYHNFPLTTDLIEGNDSTQPWTWLATKDFDSPLVATRFKTDIARLVHTIGVGCNMRYGFFGSDKSYTTPAAAEDYLSEIGYNNVFRHLGFNLENVCYLLRNDCPVFIGGLNGDNPTRGHAWVIDGLDIVNKLVVATNSQDVVQYRQVIDTNYYLHFNWGWGGDNNGWFSANMVGQNSFNSQDGYVYDESMSATSYHYDWWFRLVSYSKPNNQ